MKRINFRMLNADEISCKATVENNKWISIALHVKASTCTNLLNETVGEYNWEKSYTNGNKNCIVRVWDDEKKMMISKEDCGGPLTEVDGAKGQASNGFKRVCSLGWGLGIELYSQPNIRFPITDENTTLDSRGNLIVYETYSVAEIEYDDERKIKRCVLKDSKNRVVYDGPDEIGRSRVEYPMPVEVPFAVPNDSMMEEEKNPEEYGELIESEIKRAHVNRQDVLDRLGIKSIDDIYMVEVERIVEVLNKLKTYPDHVSHN